MPYTIKGICDDVTVCDCCGRKNLKCTVALEHDTDGIVYFGRDCAGKAVAGRKSSANAAHVERIARGLALARTLLAEQGIENRWKISSAVFNRTGYCNEIVDGMLRFNFGSFPL